MRNVRARLAAWARHFLGANTTTGGLLELVAIYVLIRLIGGRRPDGK